MEVGGWVGPGLTRKLLLLLKSSQNSSSTDMFEWYTIPCTLLKVVSYYDLSVLSMSVMALQQNK